MRRFQIPVRADFARHDAQIVPKIDDRWTSPEPITVINPVDDEARLEDERMRDHRIVVGHILVICRTLPLRPQVFFFTAITALRVLPISSPLMEWRQCRWKKAAWSLTIREVAQRLRCSKAHVSNLINGKVEGVPTLTHIAMGRRKLVRREWLDTWMDAHKTQC